MYIYTYIYIERERDSAFNLSPPRLSKETRVRHSPPGFPPCDIPRSLLSAFLFKYSYEAGSPPAIFLAHCYPHSFLYTATRLAIYPPTASIARRGTHTGYPHRGPTQRVPTQGTHTGVPHRGPTQGTHTEGPTEDPPPEGRATQGTHTEHTQTYTVGSTRGISEIWS